ncbi:DNA circularization protein [Dickeya oryzae]
MAWADNLQDAKFRGIRFDVVNVKDGEQRDIAQDEYPYIDGADVRDMGAKSHSVSLRAVFFGDDYESRLQTFLEALRKRGAAELIHPVFGSMPTMQVADWSAEHDADSIDYCTVDVQFVQSKPGNPFFVTDYPQSKSDALFNQSQSLIDSTNSLMENATKPLRTAKTMMNKVKGLTNGALNMIAVFRSDISGFVGGTTDFLNYPSAFLSDLQSALSLKTGASKSSLHSSYVGNYSGENAATEQAAAATAYTASPAVVMSDWSNTQTALTSVQTLPTDIMTGSVDTAVDMPPQLTTADIAELIVVVTIVVAIEAAAEAAGVLEDTAITAVLTPDDVEKITSDTRTMIQTAIDSTRTAFEPAMNDISSSEQPTGLTYQPVIEQLKAIARLVQEIAAAVIESKPQLIQRTVAATSNLHLVAHLWYGDYTRADELQRLNPRVRDPNGLVAGDVLNAYAE